MYCPCWGATARPTPTKQTAASTTPTREGSCPYVFGVKWEEFEGSCYYFETNKKATFNVAGHDVSNAHLVWLNSVIVWLRLPNLCCSVKFSILAL